MTAKQDLPRVEFNRERDLEAHLYSKRSCTYGDKNLDEFRKTRDYQGFQDGADWAFIKYKSLLQAEKEKCKELEGKLAVAREALRKLSPRLFEDMPGGDLFTDPWRDKTHAAWKIATEAMEQINEKS